MVGRLYNGVMRYFRLSSAIACGFAALLCVIRFPVRLRFAYVFHASRGEFSHDHGWDLSSNSHRNIAARIHGRLILREVQGLMSVARNRTGVHFPISTMDIRGERGLAGAARIVQQTDASSTIEALGNMKGDDSEISENRRRNERGFLAWQTSGDRRNALCRS